MKKKNLTPEAAKIQALQIENRKPARIKGAKCAAVTRYVLRFYSDWFCLICHNLGVFKTTDVDTGSGKKSGRRHFCVCPNGQDVRYNFGTIEVLEAWERECEDIRNKTTEAINQ